MIAGFESKNQKLVLIAINILQKLLLLHGIKDVRLDHDDGHQRDRATRAIGAADGRVGGSNRREPRALWQKSIPAVVASLRDVQELGTDVQLKSLQVLLVMVTSYDAVQGPTLFEAILVCFRLHKTKDVVVNNAAAASLRQICIELFDKVVLEAKQPGTPPEVAPARRRRGGMGV